MLLVAVGTSVSTSPTTTTLAASPTTTSTTVVPTTTALPTTTDPGQLPQTAALPPWSSAALAARLAPLWQGIQADALGAARQVFFPRSAYLSMKAQTLADPSGDYANRLLAFYGLDLATYHAALGPNPAAVPLLGVGVGPGLVGWIPAGACENGVGYWHLPGVRLEYRLGGVLHSVGVASLISWRGQWYVVHLGPNPRPVDVGTLDAPALGPGSPGPAGGC